MTRHLNTFTTKKYEVKEGKGRGGKGWGMERREERRGRGGMGDGEVSRGEGRGERGETDLVLQQREVLLRVREQQVVGRTGAWVGDLAGGCSVEEPGLQGGGGVGALHTL